MISRYQKSAGILRVLLAVTLFLLLILRASVGGSLSAEKDATSGGASCHVEERASCLLT
jgi:hypothetical protein